MQNHDEGSSSALEASFLDACKNNDLLRVNLCIEAGVDVNVKTADGKYFGLMYAAENNNTNLCDLLLTVIIFREMYVDHASVARQMSRCHENREVKYIVKQKYNLSEQYNCIICVLKFKTMY